MRTIEIEEQIDSIGYEFFKDKSEKELEEIKEALLLRFNPYDEEDCIKAISQRCNIRDIKVFTKKVYDAIIANGKFEYLENPPHNVCLDAVKYNHNNINYIDHPTLDMIEIAVMEYPPRIANINDYIEKSGEVNKPETTIFLMELYNKILKLDGVYIDYIPKNSRTKEMYNIAVETTPGAIFYYDGDDENLYLKAVKQNGLLLDLIPAKNQTIKICTEAVKQNGRAIKYVKDLSKLQF